MLFASGLDHYISLPTVNGGAEHPPVIQHRTRAHCVPLPTDATSVRTTQSRNKLLKPRFA